MSLSRRSKWIIGLVLVSTIGFLIAYRIVYAPPAKASELVADFTGSAQAFSDSLSQNPEVWNNHIVELTGELTGKDENGLVLNDNLFCQLENEQQMTSLQQGEHITIKGRFIGYDDLLEEGKLDQVICIP